jgi:hypothetical protein
MMTCWHVLVPGTESSQVPRPLLPLLLMPPCPHPSTLTTQLETVRKSGYNASAALPSANRLETLSVREPNHTKTTFYECSASTTSAPSTKRVIRAHMTNDIND